MRRGIVAAAVAGAAGITLGLMPVSGAVAAGLPETQQSPQSGNWCSDDWRGNWRDNSRWCWDDVSDASRYRNNWNWDRWNDNGNWNWNNDGNWNGNWNGYWNNGGW